VHEAYLRLVGDGSSEWDGRGHFFAAAAEAMRRILVERARRRGRIKHGGGRRRVPLDDGVMGIDPAGAGDVLAIDDALRAFEEHHADQAMLVKLRYFAGLTLEQAAEAMGISRATAARRWAYAKAWLFDRLREPESPDD
jgi:RNA polymerase sigma factor (TIGR02999 family)